MKELRFIRESKGFLCSRLNFILKKEFRQKPSELVAFARMLAVQKEIELEARDHRLSGKR